MITILTEQPTPLESFTHAVWSVYSDNPATNKMYGEFSGRWGGTGKTATISLQTRVSFAGTGVFEFDLQEFFRDNLYYDILDPAIPTDAYKAGQSLFQLQSYRFGELLDSNGQLVNGATISNFTSKYVINAARQVFNPAGLVGYVMDTAAAGLEKFLTNIPRPVSIREGESFTLSAYSESIAIDEIRIRFIDSDGNFIGSSTVIPFTTPQTGRYDIPVGLANLIAAGVTIPANAVRYQVALNNGSGNQSESFVFNIVTSCEGKRVHFLNRWGGFDSYTFTGRNTKGITTASTQYEKYLSNGFTVKDRGKQLQYRDVAPTLEFNTEILSNEEALWLEELIGTPVAYLEEDGELIPIIINDSSVTTEDLDGLKQYTVAASYANNIRNQRL